MLRKLPALVIVALATAPSALAAAGGCHDVSGTYVNHNVRCPVVALSCVVTDIAGDLAGTSFTTITSYVSSTHVYTGTVVTTLDNGAVTSNTIVGTLFGPVGDSVQTLVGGSRQFAHATGTIHSHSDGGVGVYDGVYCLGVGTEEAD